MRIHRHIYLSKKFLGIVFALDFNTAQGVFKRYCVFEVKFLFFGFYILFDEK